MDDKKIESDCPGSICWRRWGQPLTQKPTEYNRGLCRKQSPEKDLDEMLRQMQRFNAPAYLPTVS